jgi:hypothetical protein
LPQADNRRVRQSAEALKRANEEEINRIMGAKVAAKPI